ncbi:hypothetical protein [Acaryochloris sp. CCMEE 5410]|uniref:hypothetical protein n=1 Tax=Acaryochloris sp. CCMEE 5410 TaxID=310037 RepID=UPI0002485023|nr:hypothetical protein [Acaryochloris sp. CCMEE 5410]KAI9130401.1 hypothetical protein ON05_021460 [Acaryochloris sp. CCMEE 5410]
MSQYKFQLVGSVTWQKDGLQDQILYASTLELGKPKMLARIPPDLFRGPDGTLWLMSKGTVARLQGTDAADIFSLKAIETDEIIALVPTEDRSLIVLSRRDMNSVLTRLSSTGELIWQRNDLPTLQQHLTQAQLLVDFDGSTFLYAVSREVGQVVKIDLTNGSSTTVVSFESQPPQKVWVNQGSLSWVVFSDAGTHTWVSKNLETGQQHTLGEPPLQYILDQAQGSLPNGRVLLAIPKKGELIWMNSEGLETERLSIAGLVRENEELNVGIREKDLICITRWKSGEAIDPSFQVSSFSSSFSRLIAVEGNSYYVLDARKLIVFDENGHKLKELEQFEVNEQRLQREGAIAISKSVIEPAGSILLVGADAVGAYIVRISGAR